MHLVEPVSDEVMKLAGVALGKVRSATTVEAIIAAFAVEHTTLRGCPCSRARASGLSMP